MAVQKPLVLISGQIQQLPTGDSVATSLVKGNAEVSFGTAPGSKVGSVVVTGLSTIDSLSSIALSINGSDTTTTHNAIEHQLIPIEVLRAQDIVPGVGFTICLFTPLRLTGTFRVRYAIL